MARATLLFDLDGTLTDPRPGIVGCLRHALDRLGRACPDEDVLATCIGPPLRDSFARLLDTHDGALIEEGVRIYRERFGVLGLFENRVYDGVPDMLERLRGQRLLVATSKMAAFAERIVAHFDLAPYFSAIYGAEPDGRFDDKTELLAHLLRREALAPGAAIMIGDRAFDIVAARANGLRAVGVLWGYGSEHELREAGAERLCAKPAELPAVLAQLSG
jgi:phosphoglycolate phosphatase